MNNSKVTVNFDKFVRNSMKKENYSRLCHDSTALNRFGTLKKKISTMNRS